MSDCTSLVDAKLVDAYSVSWKVVIRPQHHLAQMLELELWAGNRVF